MCNLRVNEADRAKSDFLKANEMAKGKNIQVVKGLKELKEVLKRNKEKEKELNLKMFARHDEPSVPVIDDEDDEGFGQILVFFIDTFLGIYILIYSAFIKILDLIYSIPALGHGL